MPDKSKQSQCYFCEETVFFDTDLNTWVHLADGKSACKCKATPSNMEVQAT